MKEQKKSEASKEIESKSAIAGFKPNNSKSHQYFKDKSAPYYKESLEAIKKKDDKKALECFDKAITANPKPLYYAHRAEIFAKIGENAKAREDLEKIDRSKLSNTTQDKRTKDIIDGIQKKYSILFSDFKNNTSNLEVKEPKETKSLNFKETIKAIGKTDQERKFKDKYNQSKKEVRQLKEENKQIKEQLKQLEKEKSYFEDENKQYKEKDDNYQKLINHLKQAFMDCEDRLKFSVNDKNSNNNHDNIAESKEELANLGGAVQDAPD